jgi:probable F420-dependent oxidoreductase
MSSLRVGVWIPCYKPWVGRDEAKELAITAERLGFGSIWVQDHLVAPIGDFSEAPVERLGSWLQPDDYGNLDYSAVEYYGQENWWLDPYALWGFLAGVTDTIELGSCIVVLPYRHPVVQAKMLGTLDVLSGGRMLFGLGSGHVPAEFGALGASYGDRGAVTDEYIRVMKTLLSDREASYDGQFIRLPRVKSLIRPVQQPHPPFFVGGTSKRSIRRAVDLGEGWLPAHLAPANLALGVAYMREYAEEQRRPIPEIALAVTWRVGDDEREGPASQRPILSAEQVVEELNRYRAIGVTRLAVDLPNPGLQVLLRQMELLARATSLTSALNP